ncbi:MAG: ABC transporter permease [Clostridiales Family XIII bacterium]|jgi:ribose/xylose/arabinose/galactoside ABC-type transport system permease subunit|nr:ABC transporter permease [Clostridiales Family XIII bacterium]
MEHNNLWHRFIHSKAAVLSAILIVFVILISFYSSGVLSGEGFGSLFTKGFMSEGNLRGIFLGMIAQCVILCGLISLLISGNIDLSVSGQMTVTLMVFAQLCASFPGLPWPVVALLCLGLGVCLGLANTFLVNVVKIPSFIATIGMSSIYGGIASIWTRGANIQINRESFIAMGKAALFGRFPVLFVFAILLIVLYGLILAKTTFGRSIYMIGGNRKAARLSGLNAKKITMILFINNSVLAVVAGLTWAAQMKLASPSALVLAMPDMRVIAAVILGGVSFFGGAGFITGAFAGLLLLNVFDNMLSVLQVQTFWNILMQGFVLILALFFDYMSQRSLERRVLKARFGES